VVGRLAARYGIKVRLRGSFYGGVTAMVLLPTEILVAMDSRGGELEASRIEPAEVASPLVRSVGGAGPTP
jgi:hypothetical protein